MRDKGSISIVIVAILAIVFLDSFALYLGYDGALLTLAVASIAGLGGFKVRDIFKN